MYRGALSEDEEAYATSYSRLVAPEPRGGPGRRRRRGGYGHATASVLERLPPPAEGAAERGEDAGALGEEDAPAPLDAEFAADEEGVRGKPEIFLETQDDEGGSKGDEEEDDHDDSAKEALLSRLAVGVRLAVHWPANDESYPCTVGVRHAKHVYTLHYDDGEEEPEVDLRAERFAVLGEAGGAAEEEAVRAKEEDRAAAGPAMEGSDGDAAVVAAPLAAPPAATPPAAAPSATELRRRVDALFLAVKDKDAMTVGGFTRAVAAHYGWAKCPKATKKLIKARLVELMQGATPSPAEDDRAPEDEEVPAEEKEEEEVALRKKKKEKSRRKKRKDKARRAERLPRDELVST